MGPDTHHVQPHSDGGWKVQKGGAERASKRFHTKKEAKEYGREVSQNQGTEFRIHRQDGTIQESDSHGGDPYPPEG